MERQSLRPGGLILALVVLVGASGGGAAATGACVGDCGADGTVTVDELTTGVNIALGALPATQCPAIDPNADGAVTIDEILVAVANALEGCPPVPTPTRTPGPPTPTPTRTPTLSTQLELFDVGPTFFSIRKPRGWDVHIAGVCSTLGILIRDPAVPLRQIFYFGLIGPVYLREAQRQIDLDYIRGGGFNVITWLDAPAVQPLTAANFFTHWPDIAAMQAATDFMSEFPRLENLTVVSATPLTAAIPGGDSALLRGLITDRGSVGQGQFLGTVWVSSPFTRVPAGGTGYGSIILGVTAPKGEFAAVEATLVASLESFTVTQGYINWCRLQQSQLWGAVARAGQTLRETSDLIVEGWQNRSQASDIAAEKGSDALRSVERVYDPGTQQVYEVPAGWYADYDLHRDAYTLNGLQPLPPNDPGLWTAVPADGSVIH